MHVVRLLYSDAFDSRLEIVFLSVLVPLVKCSLKKNFISLETSFLVVSGIFFVASPLI